jgi:hypothetical protein
VETGSVVVLSDGSDTASKLTTPQVATAAQRQGVRIFSVGLESGAFAPGALEALAERSGGTYSLADSSRSLRRVFGDLGTRLARELLITYRSVEPATTTTTTTIDVLARTSTGIEATATYRAPALRLPAPPPPAQEGFWVSTRGIAVTAMVIGLLLAVAMTVVARRPRAARLVERIAPSGPSPRPRGMASGTARSVRDRYLPARTSCCSSGSRRRRGGSASRRRSTWRASARRR